MKKISEARIYDPITVKVKLLHMIETKFFALPPHKTYDAEEMPDGRYRVHVNYNGEKDLVSVIVNKKSVKVIGRK